MYFKNLDKSPLPYDVSPKWQEEVMKRICDDPYYEAEAIKVSDEFLCQLNEDLPNAKRGFAGKVVDSIISKTPRFCYIKNIEDDAGNLHDAQIDLLLHQVLFIEI